MQSELCQRYFAVELEGYLNHGILQPQCAKHVVESTGSEKREGCRPLKIKHMSIQTGVLLGSRAGKERLIQYGELERRPKG